MNRIITFNQAVRLSIWVFSILLVFHLTIILGILLFEFAPVEYLWGGRLETKEDLLNFELISLFLNMICLAVVLIRSGGINTSKFKSISRVFLWILTVLFALNTVGNLLAASVFEKFFAVVTVILALLCMRLASEPIKKLSH